MTFRTKAAAAILAAATAGPVWAQAVTDDQINIGLVTDLSGPIALYGSESRNGMTTAVEEINAAGGIHGRKLNLLVEDHGYDPKKAVLGSQKLITRDGVFAIIGHLGTATNMAALPLLVESEVFNFMPQGASPGLYNPPSPFKVALAPSYFDMATATLQWAYDELSPSALCILYQDDDYGRESLAGVEAYAKAKGVELVEKTSYKRGATDFSSQMQRLSAAGCDLVYNASTLREFVGSVTEARKIGFNPTFLGTPANYAIQAPGLGGEAMEGVYSSTFIPIPYTNSEDPTVAEWAQEYKATYGEDPGLYSMYGYYSVKTFAAVAEAAGVNLTAESFAAAANATDLPPDAFGNPAFDVSEDNRLSNRQVRVTQINDGKWVTVSELLSPLDIE
ncbi:ABC transporter substrate-binding protein [Sulfitobacter porphyrae]|uniref:ABC transporter substrate-binding protein n=1 Tax=Sulfitobacter porphyrae TaxID=1246864 RepID=A0ABW2B6V3_9RHOB|nr:hypothetical protein GCM10007928_41930 [Sulfitobacter porphyrae]